MFFLHLCTKIHQRLSVISTNAEKSFQKQLQWRLSLFTIIPKTRDVAKILPEVGMPLPKADTEMAKSRNHLPRNSLKLPLQVLPKPPSVTHHLLDFIMCWRNCLVSCTTWIVYSIMQYPELNGTPEMVVPYMSNIRYSVSGLRKTFSKVFMGIFVALSTSNATKTK